MNRTIRRRGWLAILAILPVAAIASVAAPVQSSTSAGCSIDGMLALPGVDVDLTPTAGAANTDALDAFQATFETATVATSETSRVSAAGVPAIDGRTAIVILFSDPTVVPAGLPAGSEPELYTVGCALAFYDASTGQYLAAVKRLDQVDP